MKKDLLRVFFVAGFLMALELIGTYGLQDRIGWRAITYSWTISGLIVVGLLVSTQLRAEERRRYC